VSGRLEDAIDDVYAAFAPYPRPTYRLSNTMGLGDLVSEALFPTRKLSSDQISAFDGDEYSFLGNLNDYKHFLPRLLDLAIQGDHYVETNADFIFEKLIRFKLSSWRMVEQVAVLNLLERAFVATFPRAVDQSQSWLCCLARFGRDVLPLLEVVKDSDPGNATRWFASFLILSAKSFLSDDAGPYWDRVDPEIRRAIALWFISAQFRDWWSAHVGMIPPNEHWHVESALSTLDENATGEPDRV
jgi:hypothetical protein